jgi:hypothetical protein
MRLGIRWLRVSEAIGIRRNEVDLDHARLWVRRLKRGLDDKLPMPATSCAPSSVTAPFEPPHFPGFSSPSRSRGKP